MPIFMPRQQLLGRAAIASLVLFLSIRCAAQDPLPFHSCTLNAGGDYVRPSGTSGDNFSKGWGGFQAGGGFAVTHPVEPRRGVVLYLTGNFVYNRLDAIGAALAQATNANPSLSAATSAHGSFSAATLDPTVRIPLSPRWGLYGSGGFGWFRQGVGFNISTPATLIQPGNATLARLAANSGVFDAGGGINFGITPKSVMLYAEVRVYRGLAINSATTLMPISFGIRW
jgi:hypothetical protein